LFINDPYTKKQGGPLVLKPLEPLFDAGAKKNREFFTKKVLGKGGYKSTTKEDFERMSRSAQESMYKSYLEKRMSNKTDAYGNKLNINSGPDNQVVQAPLVATTMPVEELPQQIKAPESVMTSEEARTKANLLLKKKRGTRTKSSLIATSPQGITDDKGLTLGQKSLLG
jgi:hypothetical protein